MPTLACTSSRCSLIGPANAARSRRGRPRGRRRRGHQHGELVAAEPDRQAVVADLGPEHLGDRDQQLVTDVMAERVVDGLEVVQVDQQHGRRPPAPGCAPSRCRNSARLASPVRPSWVASCSSRFCEARLSASSRAFSRNATNCRTVTSPVTTTDGDDDDLAGQGSARRTRRRSAARRRPPPPGRAAARRWGRIAAEPEIGAPLRRDAQRRQRRRERHHDCLRRHAGGISEPHREHGDDPGDDATAGRDEPHRGPSTGPPATYDTLVAAPTATRNASPTSTVACRLHGSSGGQHGGQPGSTARPRSREPIARSSSMRHHSTPPVVTGTRATAQMAIPKPTATQAAAGPGMLRVWASGGVRQHVDRQPAIADRDQSNRDQHGAPEPPGDPPRSRLRDMCWTDAAASPPRLGRTRTQTPQCRHRPSGMPRTRRCPARRPRWWPPHTAGSPLDRGARPLIEAPPPSRP